MDVYEGQRSLPNASKIDKRFPLQIDDQDENDNLNEFCNIFCIIGNKNNFCLELTGNFPITQTMEDLADIYNGETNRNQGRLSLHLNIDKIEAVMDLADRIRKTSFMGDNVNNANWLANSARTISSLYRFVRIIKEYTGNGNIDESVPRQN